MKFKVKRDPLTPAPPPPTEMYLVQSGGTIRLMATSPGGATAILEITPDGDIMMVPGEVEYKRRLGFRTHSTTGTVHVNSGRWTTR